MNFAVDPARRKNSIETGIKVLARTGRTWVAADISQLTSRSLLRYLQNAPGRSYPPMTLAVTALGEPNIEAVVAYLASLK